MRILKWLPLLLFPVYNCSCQRLDNIWIKLVRVISCHVMCVCIGFSKISGHTLDSLAKLSLPPMKASIHHKLSLFIFYIFFQFIFPLLTFFFLIWFFDFCFRCIAFWSQRRTMTYDRLETVITFPCIEIYTSFCWCCCCRCDKKKIWLIS